MKTLTNQVQYLRLGSFSTSIANLGKSQRFYDSIQNQIDHPFLIVDLRNNGGGGFKNSKKYLDLLKEYSKTGKIYALINQKTFSNAEQFSIELKDLENSILLGVTTSGTITYGNNYGRTITLTSGKFSIYPTDMRDDGHYLPYEEIGVHPDIKLSPDSEWIGQTLQLIGKNQ